MSKRIDITGNRYGSLTVKRMIYNEKKKNYSHCECVCDCGNTVIKSCYHLRNAKQAPSCGCKITEQLRSRAKCINGQKFNRLLVIDTYLINDKYYSKCVCDCGNIVTLSKYDITSGHTKSCGCLQKEIASKNRARNDSNYISDYNVKIIKPFKRNEKNQMLWECECGYCGKKFYELPARIKNNHTRSCGCLNYSSSEKYIQGILDDLEEDYKAQYTFEDCKSANGVRLRFDFAVFKNNDLCCLIEYDGEQHYKPVEYFGGEKSFLDRVENDKIKDDYCSSHNIRLLRLPYYLNENEIKETITNTLNP